MEKLLTVPLLIEDFWLVPPKALRGKRSTTTQQTSHPSQKLFVFIYHYLREGVGEGCMCVCVLNLYFNYFGANAQSARACLRARVQEYGQVAVKIEGES